MALPFICCLFVHSQQEDQYLWLEEIDAPKALEWVEAQNKETFEDLTQHPNFEKLYQKNLEIFNSKEQIAFPTIRGEFVYNFWQDEKHVRGIWRRASLKNYLDEKPDWETLIDIDQLREKESEDWVYKWVRGLAPNYDKFLVALSRGGGDAVVIREFDVTTKSFVKDGFQLPEAKGSISWVDENTVMVSTSFGEETMTDSGYPRQVKVWKRETDLKDATLVVEGETSDVGVWGFTEIKKDKRYQFVTQNKTFYTSQIFAIQDDKALPLHLPEDATFTALFKGNLIIELKSDWTLDKQTFPQGAIVSIPYEDFLKGKTKAFLLDTPNENASISGVRTTENRVLISQTVNVKSELYTYEWKDNKWNKNKINAPDLGTIYIGSTSDNSDDFFFYFENFLYPRTQYTANAQTGEMRLIQSLPHFFDSDKFEVNQYWANSKDGTKIPYFVVAAKDVEYNGKNPTLMYSYGGYEVSLLPNYSGTLGTAWLEKGGVYVLANIRGGGEFGPKWHQAGLKENRQKVFDDFTAVAENLIEKKITSPQHLGIQGGSNGGLLVGVAFTQRPDLYKAVVCGVPLLDMKRFNKLLAGASWMSEYGNPDIEEEWAYIQKYSPYHNLKKDEKYPKVFFYTSTRDDRVHPAHARKMVAKMQEMGHDVYYYENTEGGHAAASTKDQRAHRDALIYTYLIKQLK